MRRVIDTPIESAASRSWPTGEMSTSGCAIRMTRRRRLRIGRGSESVAADNWAKHARQLESEGQHRGILEHGFPRLALPARCVGAGQWGLLLPRNWKR